MLFEQQTHASCYNFYLANSNGPIGETNVYAGNGIYVKLYVDVVACA